MADTMKPVVAGIGEILWDILPTGRQSGGAPGNFAYHAGALGASAAIISMVGIDNPGDELLEQYASHGLDIRYIGRDLKHPTGKVTVTLDSDGVPVYTIHENTAWDYLDSKVIPGLDSLAASCHAVCFGTLSQRSPYTRDAIASFLDATSSNCLRVFDINLRQQYYTAEIIESLLLRAEVLKLNDEEFPVVTLLLGIDGSEDEQFHQLIRTYNLNLVALTRGSHGSRLVGQSIDSEHPGFAVDIVDTVGAGDSFTATMTVGLLHGMSLDEINDAANRVAAYVCTQSGAMPDLPDTLKSQFKSVRP